MAESVVTAVVQWIGSLLIQEASTLFEVEDQVLSLHSELEIMQQYLQDADAKQDAREVRTLICQIRKLAYDAEDVIDTYILKVQSKAKQSRENRFMIFACFLCNTYDTYTVGKQIQVIQSGVKRIHERLNGYGVRRDREMQNGLISSRNERYWRKVPQSYPYDDTNGDYVVGLDRDIPKLLDVLMGEGNSQVNFLFILGMGGSGKSTLARKLYNHPYAKECFDCMAWAFVSQEWSTRHILYEILRKIGGTKQKNKLHSGSSVEELVDFLRNMLKKRSYLVVLDDVWRREALEEIIQALPRESINKGSKIIITTRNREIIQFHHLQKRCYIHEPQPLNEEEGWKLFSKIALSLRTNPNTEDFEILGKEMLKKCNGLPLAIVVLAGILKTRENIREWQQVGDAVRARVMEGKCMHMYGSVQDLLSLSYDDLPYYLKPCFLHLSVFPEDCQISVGLLTRMWIAEGFVTAHKEMVLEDVAMQYLEELSYRFMIQVVRSNYNGAFKAIHMHDLLRELCVEKAKEQSFLQIYTPLNTLTRGDDDIYAVSSQPRRAALHSSICLPEEVSNLRSLVLLTRSSIFHSAYVTKEIMNLEILHCKFKLLRLLNLWGIKTTTGKLPTQIGNLIHLRYLGIRASNITELPVSIGNLRNLLTLDYRNVECDTNTPITIPNVFCNLVVLRHLFLPMECAWRVKDLQLSKLNNLQILFGIKHGGGKWFPRELSNLRTSIKKLKIFVSVEEHLAVAFSCPSLVSDGLHTFHCELRDGLAIQNVEPLSQYKRLHKLVMVGRVQMDLSLLLPSNLVMLEMKDSMLKDGDPMTALGALAHLKILRLRNFFLGTTFTCELDSFPQLNELYLENFPNLKVWMIRKGAMTCLKKLEIKSCISFSKFPQGLKFVTSLQQLDFFGVPQEFEEKAIELGWFQKRANLPHNMEKIIKEWDFGFHFSSVRELYETLTAGIYLNNKRKRYWVVKKGGRYNNCFMLFSMDLTFADSDCWGCNEMAERDGALITVAKLEAQETVLHVSGKFETEDLSPNVSYMVSYIIKLEESESGWTRPLYLTLTIPGHKRQERSEKLDDKPKDEWIQVLAGKYQTSSQNVGELRFSLRYPLEWPPLSKGGIVIKGVSIEPML